ncbi:MAG: thiol protease/hemagglutinin PrtT [Paludibacteraceae bacterium]|nr:thiol protease/hemagglutinin PrtT [Paludibacteraceae bacterium]
MEKNFRKVGILLLGLSYSLTSFADVINEDLAKTVASNYFWKKTGEKRGIERIDKEYHNGEVSIYAFNFTGGGWVLVSRNDDVDPILGYSKEGTFTIDKKERPDGMNFLLDLYGANITAQGNALRSKNVEVHKMWDDLINYDGSNSETLRSYQITQSLMYDPSVGYCVQWGQGSPYNSKCPVSGSQHTYVGCTGTALAQLMWKWKWPSHSVVTDKNNNTYYDKYDWNLMPYTLSGKTAAEIEQVANLSWKTGLACHMNYGLQGSGAWPRTEALGMFRYSYLQKYMRSDYTNSHWINMLRTEVKAGRPVVYVGYKNDGNGVPTAGHTFLICGHDEASMFYINFGWNGSGDNVLYNLSGTATGSSSEYISTNTAQWQRAVVGISPTYPRTSNNVYFGHSSVSANSNLYECSSKNIIAPTGNALTVYSNSNLDFEAGESIKLRKGFNAKKGAKFKAKINSEFAVDHNINVSYNSVTTGSSGKVILNVSKANSWYIAIKNSSSNVIYRNCGNINSSSYQAVTLWTGNASSSYSYEAVFLNNYGVIKKVTGTFNSSKQNISVSDYNPLNNDAFHYITTPFSNNAPIAQIEEENIINVDDANNALSIYPNPSTGIFTVDFGEDNTDNKTLRIFDLAGKVIYEVDILGKEASIDLSDQEKGVYFIQTISNGKANVQKIILK